MKEFLRIGREVATLSFVVFIILFTLGALAQVPPDLAEISNSDFFTLAMKDLTNSNFNGGVLVIAGLVVQIAVRFFKTPLAGSLFPKLTGAGKITVVYLLSLLAGIIALKSQGLSWSATLLHSQTVFAYGVAINQLFKQFGETLADNQKS